MYMLINNDAKQYVIFNINSFTIIKREYFGVKIVGCNCTINQSFDQEYSNYVSSYLNLLNF